MECLAQSNRRAYDLSRIDDTSFQIPGQWLASCCSSSPAQHLLQRRAQMDNAAFAVEGVDPNRERSYDLLAEVLVANHFRRSFLMIVFATGGLIVVG